MALPDFIQQAVDKKTAENDRQETIEGYENILGTLQDRLSSADQRSGMSVRDLYGDSIDRSADSVRSNANATKSALSRLSTARGGDVSGAGNVAFNRVDERANEGVSNIIQHYTDRASTDREQSQARGDRITSQMMGGQLNLAQLAEQELMRNLQREQAQKQRSLGLLGTLGSVAGTILGGPAGGAAGGAAGEGVSKLF